MEIIITLLNSNSAKIGAVKIVNLIMTKNPSTPADKQEIVNNISHLYYVDKHIHYVINQTLKELLPLIGTSKLTKESVHFYTELLTAPLIDKIIKKKNNDDKF